MAAKLKIKKGDRVIVISGRDKGKITSRAAHFDTGKKNK